MTDSLISDGKPDSFEVGGETYYYKNGTVNMHNNVMAMMSEKGKRQQAFAKAVQYFRTDENGKATYDPNNKDQFTSLISPNAKHNVIRELGMKMMGMSADDEEGFEAAVEDEIKNAPVKTQAGSV